MAVTVKKLSITLPSELAAEIERLARKRGIALSTWISEAAEAAARQAAGFAAIAEYEAEFGSFTEDEIAAVEAQLARADAINATPRRGKARPHAA